MPQLAPPGAVCAAACTLALLTAACGGGEDGPTGVPASATVVASVEVTPAGPVTLSSMGATRTFTAVAKNAAGAAIAGPPFTWTSTNTAVATVSAAGVLTAVANGSTTVTATSGSVTSNAVAVTVAQAVATVRVSSARQQSDAFGDTIRFSAQLSDSAGNSVQSAAVSWSVDAPSVAEISSDGLLRTRGNGTVTVTAQAGSASGTANLTVTQRATALRASRDSLVLDRWGDTTSVSVTAVDRLGATVASLSVTAASSDTAVAAMVSAGSTTWRVRSGRDGSAALTLAVTADTTLRATVPVRVAVQRNAMCRLPAAPTPRGAPAGPVSWDVSIIAGSPIPRPDDVFIGPIAAPAPMDIDWDGDLDVVVPYYLVDSPARTGRTVPGMKVFRNDGGTLVEATALLWGARAPSWSYPRVPVRLDADGDGRRDLLLLDTGYDPAGFTGCGPGAPCPGARNTLLLAGGPGVGVVDGTSRLTTNAANAFSHAGDAADVDCDGDDDFFEGTWGNSEAPEPSHLHINRGGTFTVEDDRLPADLPRREGFVGFMFCDIDRDGDPDGIVSLYGRRPRIMMNDGFGRFRLLPESAIPEPLGGDARAEYAAMGCGDWDGDGWNDLALGRHAAHVSGEAVTVLLNNRNGTFRDGSADARTTMAAESAYGWPWSLEVTDLNRDGWPDLLLMSPFVRGRVLYGAGAGRYTEWVFPNNDSFFWMSAGNQAVAADFTGDGRPDIYVYRGRFDHVLLRNR